jgi:hypothetical protein
LYAREKGLATWREAEGLGERLPRMQAFARGVAWLRAYDPARHTRLARQVKHYRTLSETLGAGEGDVPPDYRTPATLRYIMREAIMLGIGLPLAALGMVFWYPPYALNKLIVGRLNVEETGIATYKLGLSMLLLPLTFIVWCVIAYTQLGVRGLIVALILLPLLGMVLHRWTARWDRVRQDTRLFAKVIAHPRTRHKLAEQRTTLVREFDDVARRL